MKFAVKIVLIIFIAFLSTPTIVSLIEKKGDTSLFYSMAEEEQPQKEDIKLMDSDFIFPCPFELVVFSNPVSIEILSKNQLKCNNISGSIFTPPPEQT